MTMSIVGDGLAGLMLANRLLELGEDVTLFGDGQTNTPPVGLVHLFAGRSFRRSAFELQCFEQAVDYWRQEPLALELPIRRRLPEGGRLQKSLQEARLPESWAPQPAQPGWVTYGPGFSVAAREFEAHLRQRLGARYRQGHKRWQELPGPRILALGYQASEEWARDWDLSRGRTVEAESPPLAELTLGCGVHRAPFPGRASVVVGGRSLSNASSPGDELECAHMLTELPHRELECWWGQRCAPRDHRPLLGWLDRDTFVFVGFGSRGLFWLPHCVRLAGEALTRKTAGVPAEVDWARSL